MKVSKIETLVEEFCDKCPLPDCNLSDALSPLDCQVVKSAMSLELKTVARRRRGYLKQKTAEPDIIRAVVRNQALLRGADIRKRDSIRKQKSDKKRMTFSVEAQLKKQESNRRLYGIRRAEINAHRRARYLLKTHSPKHFETYKKLREAQEKAAVEVYLKKNPPSCSRIELRKLDKSILNLSISAFLKNCKFITPVEYVEKNNLELPPRDQWATLLEHQHCWLSPDTKKLLGKYKPSNEKQEGLRKQDFQFVKIG